MSAGGLRKLEVRLETGPGRERVVGTLAAADGRSYFEYAPAFLEAPLPLSPFKLPPRPGLAEHRDRDFGPIFGLFADSLPDGWGLLLMDRLLRQKGIRPAEVGPLERLAFLGRRTLGALTYHPPAEAAESPLARLDLDALAAASAEVLRGQASEILPLLLRAGGSPAGARPKVLVGVRGDEVVAGEAELPDDYEAWLVKFPADSGDRDVGKVEEAYARMARAAGIDLPPTRLFETRQGAFYFGVRRFDRGKGGSRHHIHSFGNLIHADFRLPSCDYRQLFEVTRVLTRSQKDLRQQFRRMAFNVAAHNRDDHVKNFAFLMNERGEWSLTPAYDLNFAEGPGGEHTTTVAGKGKGIQRRDLLTVAGDVGIAAAEAEALFAEVAAAVETWPRVATELDIGAQLRKKVAAAIDANLARLD